MPFPKDVVAQLDYNSRLRLTICFFRMKAMLKSENEEDSVLDDVLSGECGELGGEKERMAPAPANSMEVVRPVSLFKSGMLQDLMCEVGCVVCVCLCLSLSLLVSLSLSLSHTHTHTHTKHVCTLLYVLIPFITTP